MLATHQSLSREVNLIFDHAAHLEQKVFYRFQLIVEAAGDMLPGAQWVNSLNHP